MPDTVFDWFDTPNPVERGFSIECGEPLPHSLGDGAIPDFLNTTVLFSNLPRWVTSGAQVPENLQSYRLVHTAKTGQMRRQFFFAKTRTAQERATPFFEEFEKRPFSWPPVLLKLWAEEGLIPLTAITAAGDITSQASKLVRTRYKPGGMLPTWFRIKHYLSEQPFPQATRQSVPITDAIHWEFDGMKGGFPECLHPDVTISNTETTGKVIFGFGTDAGEIGGDMVSQEFPATPHTDWTSYVLEDSRQKVMGLLMQYRTVVEVLPPVDPRRSILGTA